jgi:hypothetical protein
MKDVDHPSNWRPRPTSAIGRPLKIVHVSQTVGRDEVANHPNVYEFVDGPCYTMVFLVYAEATSEVITARQEPPEELRLAAVHARSELARLLPGWKSTIPKMDTAHFNWGQHYCFPTALGARGFPFTSSLESKAPLSLRIVVQPSKKAPRPQEAMLSKKAAELHTWLTERKFGRAWFETPNVIGLETTSPDTTAMATLCTFVALRAEGETGKVELTE